MKSDQLEEVIAGILAGDDRHDPKVANQAWRLAHLEARMVVKTICASIPGLADVMEGRAVIVPVQETAKQWERGQALIRQQGGETARRTVDCATIYFGMLNASPYRDKTNDDA